MVLASQFRSIKMPYKDLIKRREASKRSAIKYRLTHRDLILAKNRKRRLDNIVAERAYQREYWKTHKYPETKKAWLEKNPTYHLEWGRKNVLKQREYVRKNYQKHKDTVRKYQTFSNSEYKNRTVVERLTRKMFKKDDKCGCCGDTGKLQFHHWKYQLPVERKDFSTLCTFCHGVQHGRNKPI